MSNLFIGTGNVGKAPELRNVVAGGSGKASKVLELRVFFDAYKRNSRDELVQDEEASFWKTVVLWNERAERAAKHLVKGARVHVEGRIKAESWTDKASGEIRTGDSVVADDVYLSFSRVDSITWKAPNTNSANKQESGHTEGDHTDGMMTDEEAAQALAGAKVAVGVGHD